MKILKAMRSHRPLSFLGGNAAQNKAAMAQLAHSIQNVLAEYKGIGEMSPEAAAIAGKLSPLFDNCPEQALENARVACQKHLHQLMLEALDQHGGDLESIPEARSIIRAVFQLTILRNISTGEVKAQVA